MTRWVRVGNSQKHKKLPEDATPWKDFWQNQNSPDKTTRNKVKSGRIEKSKHKTNKKFDIIKQKAFENPENKSNSKSKNVVLDKSEHIHSPPKFSSSRNEMNEEHLNIISNTEVLEVSKKARKKAKLHQLKKSNDIVNNSISNYSHSSEVSQNNDKSTNENNFQGKKKFFMQKKIKEIQNSENKNNSKSKNVEQEKNSPKFSSKNEINEDLLNIVDNIEFQEVSKKSRKKAKLKQLKDIESNNIVDNSTSNKSCSTEISKNDKINENDFQGKKKLFMQKLEKKRKENGILLLPAKVERKLYNIKRRLREKGLPPAAIKEIARKERRKEELKFRQSASGKPCFNCRQVGHFLAECPMKLGNSNQETGICFKCGSAAHTSYKCPEKIKGYPLAKCFICKEQGHVSKDCPQNEHGVYIKGGKCGLCGNVNHLKKDCPTLRKKKDEEDITAYTINEGKSIDAEIIPAYNSRKDVRTSGKKAKLVKF